MLAVGLSAKEVRPLLHGLSSGEAVIGCINSPSSVTVSGDASAIDEVQAKLADIGAFHRKLLIKVAGHSPHLETVAEQYIQSLKDVQGLPGDSNIGMFSTLTGGLIEATELVKPQYWASNMTRPVLFLDAIQSALVHRTQRRRKGSKTCPIGLFLEIGPHSALQGPCNQIMDSNKLNGAVPYVSILQRKRNAHETMLEAVGRLIQGGVDVDLERANNPLGALQGPILCDLPPYAWNHDTTYWHESASTRAFRFREHPRLDLLGVRDEHSSKDEPCWINYLRVSEVPWMEDHKVQSSILYPFAGMVVMAIEGCRQMAHSDKEFEGFQLRDVTASAAMVISPEEPLETKLQLRSWRSGSLSLDSEALWKEFVISSRNQHGEWTTHCHGLISTKYKSGIQDKCEKDHSIVADGQNAGVHGLSGQDLKQRTPSNLYESVSDALLTIQMSY